MRLAFVLALLASTASAETFNLSLGGSSIGSMTFDGSTLRSSVTDSPMGVANGAFLASSRRVQQADGSVVTQYLSEAPRKNRTISVLHDGGRAVDTTVSPSSDATALSDPAAVPAGVIDPVQALARMTSASSCPSGMSFYDGRRVITLSPSGASQDGTTQTCNMDYRVTAGPGHMSPLFIKKARMELTYTAGRLSQISIGSGPFTLYVTR